MKNCRSLLRRARAYSGRVGLRGRSCPWIKTILQGCSLAAGAFECTMRLTTRGCLGMKKGMLMALLLSVGLSVPAAAVKQYPRYGDPGPGGVWNDGPYACLPGQSCTCHPDAYVAVRCERTPDGPGCWWNSNCYCEPPMANQYCGSRSGIWSAFRKRPKY